MIEYAVTCNKSIIEDVFNLPPHLEDNLDSFISFAEPRSGSTDNHLIKPSVEVTGPEDAFNVVSGDDEELMEIETTSTPDDCAVASADPQTLSEKSPPSTLSEIPLSVNDNSDPLPQYQTNPCKPSVSPSIITTWTLDVDIDDYLVPPPKSKTEVNLTSTTVSSSIRNTWTLDVDVDGYLVHPPLSQTDSLTGQFTLPTRNNTDGDIVVTVAPIPAPSLPSRSWTVIKQGPVLSARQPGTPAPCSRVSHKSLSKSNSGRQVPSPVTRQSQTQAQGQDQTVVRKGGRRVPQSNAERCTTYRRRQKAKKEKEDEELRTLSEQNRRLKAKEAALRNNISKIKAALLKIGLGGYFC